MADPIRVGDFWRGPAEAAIYLEAVRQNPQREDEGPISYIRRIAEIVAKDMGTLGEQALEGVKDWRGM